MVSVVKTIFIPIYGAFISWILGRESSTTEPIVIILAAGVGVAIVYMIFIGAYSVMNPLINNEFTEMQHMVDKIEGMLDRKYDVEKGDIVKV